MIGQTISNYRVVEKFGVSLNYLKFLQRNAQRYKLTAQKLIAHKEGAYFYFHNLSRRHASRHRFCASVAPLV